MFLIHVLLLCFSLGIWAADKDEAGKGLIKENVYTTGKPESLEEPQTARLKEMQQQAAELKKQEQKTPETPSDKKLSGVVVKVLCKDATEPIDCPIEYVKAYFLTLKNMIEDLGTDSPIPLENVTPKVFECLMTIAQALYNTNPRNTLQDARETFQKIKELYPTIGMSDLLIQANYLDVTATIYDHKYKTELDFRDLPASFTFKSLLASLYADSLKTRAPQITNVGTNLVSCDDLPFELEPLVAGWLLHDLLENTEPVIEKREFTPSGKSILPLTFSSSGSQHGFTFIWEQMDRSRSMNRIDYHYAYFDFSKKDRFQEKSIANTIEAPFDIGTGSQCALSEDGRYILLLFDNNPSKIALFDLLQPKENKRKQVEPIQVITLDQPITNIVSLLFNDKMGMFTIIACSDVPPTRTFYLYSASPSPTTLYLSEPQTVDVSDRKKVTTLACDMDWSYINGQLIGVWGNGATIYKNKMLYACSFDQEGQTWSYIEGDKNHIVDFCVIPTIVSQEKDSFGHYAGIRQGKFAVQNFFIPNFKQLLTKNLKEPISDSVSHFDSGHICKYFIRTKKPSEVGIQYPWDPRVMSALKILDKRVTSNQHHLLIDAYFLYHYHMNNATWRTYCKETMQYISEEISKIYKLGEKEEESASSWWFFPKKKS